MQVHCHLQKTEKIGQIKSLRQAIEEMSSEEMKRIFTPTNDIKIKIPKYTNFMNLLHRCYFTLIIKDTEIRC